MSSRSARRAPYDGDLRRDLMDAALNHVASADPASLSLRAVARSVGVSHAAPKNHFESKTGLLTAIASEGFQRLGQSLETAASNAGSGLKALEAAGRAYIEFALTEPGYFRVMWRNDLLDQQDTALEAAGQAAFEGLLAIVRAAQADGWGTDQDPADLVTLAWSTVHGVAQLHLDGPLPDMDPRPIDEVAAGLTRLLVAAFQG